MVREAGTKSGSPMWWRSSFFATTPRMKSSNSASVAPRRISACSRPTALLASVIVTPPSSARNVALVASAFTTFHVAHPLYALAFAGMTPFGPLLVGTIPEQLGVRTACALGGTYHGRPAGSLSTIR